jgi:hypothetical protein
MAVGACDTATSPPRFLALPPFSSSSPFPGGACAVLHVPAWVGGPWQWVRATLPRPHPAFLPFLPSPLSPFWLSGAACVVDVPSPLGEYIHTFIYIYICIVDLFIYLFLFIYIYICIYA